MRLLLLALCISTGLFAQEAKSEFSILYLPTFPLSSTTEYRDIGPQWFGGGFIFGGGKVTKGLLTYNYINSVGGPFTNFRELSSSSQVNANDIGALGHVVSLGFVLDFPEGFFLVASPSVLLGTKGIIEDQSGDQYTFPIELDFEDRLGYKAGLGVQVQYVRVLAIYESLVQSLSIGVAFRF